VVRLINIIRTKACIRAVVRTRFGGSFRPRTRSSVRFRVSVRVGIRFRFCSRFRVRDSVGLG
jgi:hypothetical protein